MKRINSIQTTVTVDNGLFSVGDVAGGIQTFAYAVAENGGAAMVRGVRLAGVVNIA